MVIGQYHGNVGSGNRVSFPSKFRREVGDTLTLTTGLDGNILIFNDTNWKTLLTGVENKPFTNKEARELLAFLLGNAAEVVLDRLGRFVIPEHLVQFGSVTGAVVFIGMHTHVQLWDKNRWDIYQERIQKNIDTITKKLSGNE